MKSKYIILALVGIVILTSGAFFLRSENKKTNSVSEVLAPVVSNTHQVQEGALREYTPADVALHGSSSSCWTSIGGTVYDVTEWISKHPGGEAAIRSLCGVDGTEAFNGQHGGQRRPASELEAFSIGTLKP